MRPLLLAVPIAVALLLLGHLAGVIRIGAAPDAAPPAARALAEIDRDAAREEAARILASDRAPFLDGLERSALEGIAKE